MRNLHFTTLVLVLISTLSVGPSFAGQATPQTQPATPATQPSPPVNPDEAALSVFLDRIITSETTLTNQMKDLHPIVETYLQTLDKDNELTFRPIGDRYFLGKLDFKSEDKQQTFLKKDGMTKNILGKISQFYSV